MIRAAKTTGINQQHYARCGLNVPIRAQSNLKLQITWKREQIFWDGTTTPREELWSEIKRLETQLEIQEYNLARKQGEVDRLRDGLKNSEKERVAAYHECAKLKDKLMKFDRQRGAEW